MVMEKNKTNKKLCVFFHQNNGKCPMSHKTVNAFLGMAI